MTINFTDNVIKVKCITNIDKDNKQHLITIGDIYNAKSTTSQDKDKYYFINETKTAVPQELFITIDELLSSRSSLREQKLNTILLSSRSSLPNNTKRIY